MVVVVLDSYQIRATYALPARRMRRATHFWRTAVPSRGFVPLYIPVDRVPASRLVVARETCEPPVRPADSNLVARETRSSLFFGTSWYVMIAVRSAGFSLARRWRVRCAGVYASICSSKVANSVAKACTVYPSPCLALSYATVVLRLRFTGSSTASSTKDLKSSQP